MRPERPAVTWADYVIVGIIALSVVIGVLRGFVREALSLLSWVVAIWVAIVFSRGLADLLAGTISVPSLRLAVAFAVLFVAVLILGALVGYLAGQLVRKTGLSGTDRMIGILFGVVRGVAIVAVLVLLAGLTPLPQDPWWNESMFIGHFEEIALWMRQFLPSDVADQFAY